MQPKTITLPADLFERVEQEAGDGAQPSMKSHRGREARACSEMARTNSSQADTRRGNKTAEEVDASVDTVIQEWRREQHGR